MEPDNNLENNSNVSPLQQYNPSNSLNNQPEQPINEEISINTESISQPNEQEIKTPNENLNNENINNNPENKKKGKSKLPIIIVLILLIVALALGYVFLFMNKDDKNTSTNKDINTKVKSSEYRMSGNSLEAFDLYFLKLENEKVNKIYSPLSIKYALEMLAEGSDGNSKAQLDAVIGDYEAKKYTNSENMSFANALFIRNSFKDSVKEEYKNLLLNKYNAEVKLDSFENANAINSWVKDKTLGLLDNLVDDKTVQDLEFALINALAIDMEWEEKFLNSSTSCVAMYAHETLKDINSQHLHTCYDMEEVVASNFNDMNDKISGMDVSASLNNYDIISELGEDNIRKTVGDAYREYLSDPSNSSEIIDEDIEKIIDKYLDEYIEEISSNYKKNDRTTDFSLYVDDDVKVFAKDLKEYNGTTLEYVGIMPINVELDSYINDLTVEKVNTLISNLKDLKLENFKDGVVTIITGHIPKFKFDYELKLMDDLKKLGIEDVFDVEKANLSKLTSAPVYITTAKHKANIEFTQDGIKAAAASMSGGAGAAGFDYIYEIPYEEIDITFDKPYMFIIRDKNTGEVWFVGTVYNPLLFSEDTTSYCYQYPNNCR